MNTDTSEQEPEVIDEPENGSLSRTREAEGERTRWKWIKASEPELKGHSQRVKKATLLWNSSHSDEWKLVAYLAYSSLITDKWVTFVSCKLLRIVCLY